MDIDKYHGLDKYFARALLRNAKAKLLITDLTYGRKAWKTSEPVDINDSDLTMGLALSDVPQLIEIAKDLIVVLKQYERGTSFAEFNAASNCLAEIERRIVAG
jgi:hypothetical protein